MSACTCMHTSTSRPRVCVCVHGEGDIFIFNTCQACVYAYVLQEVNHDLLPRGTTAGRANEASWCLPLSASLA